MQWKRSTCNDLHRALPAETSLMTLHTRTGRRAITAGLLAAVLCPGALAAARDDATATRPITPENAAYGVLRRVIPARADRFVLATIPRRNGLDVFEVEAAGGRVRVRGSSEWRSPQESTGIFRTPVTATCRGAATSSACPNRSPRLPGRSSALPRSLIVTSSTTAHSVTRWPGGTGRSGSG